MNLTNNFTLEEFTISQEAERRGIDNAPPKNIVKTLIYTAENMELVRNVLNSHPIIISSAYRSPVVNAAVGGSKNSQHMTGQAVDFTCPKFGTPREIVQRIKNSGLEYDQLILEFDRWVHISFSESGNRKQLFAIDRNGVHQFA